MDTTEAAVASRKLPELCVELSFGFDLRCGIATMKHSEMEDDCFYSRNDGRWRWRHSLFMSCHQIASDIFEYSQPPTQSEMDFMGDFVCEIGKMLDAMAATARDDYRRDEEKRLFRQSVMHMSMMREQGEAIVESQSVSLNHDYLYLMRHVNGLTKIGVSRNPKVREKTLQAEDPRLEMIFKSECRRSEEKRLHKIFESARVRGEWFALEDRHIGWIRDFYEMKNKVNA